MHYGDFSISLTRLKEVLRDPKASTWVLILLYPASALLILVGLQPPNASACAFAQYTLLLISGIWIVWVCVRLFIREHFPTWFRYVLLINSCWFPGLAGDRVSGIPLNVVEWCRACLWAARWRWLGLCRLNALRTSPLLNGGLQHWKLRIVFQKPMKGQSPLTRGMKTTKNYKFVLAPLGEHQLSG
jgi:hypothetical protein